MDIKIKKILLIASVFILSGCTLITDLEIYKLVPKDEISIMLKEDNITATGRLIVTGDTKLYIPIFYQKYIEKNPYEILITIYGELDDIEVIQSRISINEGEEEKIYNLTRNDFEYSPLSDRRPFFYLKKETYLDYPWEKIQEVELIFEFYGIKDNQKTRYLAKKVFKPEYKSLITNDAMSI